MPVPHRSSLRGDEQKHLHAARTPATTALPPATFPAPLFASSRPAGQVTSSRPAGEWTRRDSLRALLPAIATPLLLRAAESGLSVAAADIASLRAVPPEAAPAGRDDRSPSIDLHLGPERGFAKWWIPEHVMLGHTDRSLGVAAPVVWQSQGNGDWQYQSPLADRGLATVRVRSLPTGFEGSITLENRSRDIWTHVVAAVCLLLPDSPSFADPEWQRTFYRHEGQFRVYGGQERDSGDGTFQMSLVRGRSPLVRSQRHMRKWGFTTTPSDDGVIAVGSRDGSATLVTTWERVHHLQANRQPNYRCIHPNPYFGAIHPGETKTVSGCVLMVPGDTATAWQAAHRWLDSRRS